MGVKMLKMKCNTIFQTDGSYFNILKIPYKVSYY